MLRIVLLVALGGLAAVPAQASAPLPSSTSRLMVSGREFSFALSRQSLAKGPALIQFVNRGEDAHDLRLKRIGTSSVVRFPETGAGELSQRSVALARGKYRLWCSLAGHRKRGMRTTLTVRR